MTVYRDQVAAAADAVTILGSTRYAWLGRRSRRLDPSLESELDEAQRRRYLVACLTEELYCSFYCHGAPVAARWGESQPTSGDPRLLLALSRANNGRGGWENGWRAERVGHGEVVARSAGLRVRIPARDCESATPEPGAAIGVRLPKELPSLSPGFWFAVSDAPVASLDVRVYWHVTRAGAPALVRALTTRLNDGGVPFRLKVANHPYRFERCDTAVLYLDGPAFRERRSTIDDVAAALAGHLRPAVPALTLKLAPGVGAAEDPDGESFGARRCSLLADAIVATAEAPVRGVDAIAATFAATGVDIDAPYRAGRDVL